MHVRKNGFHVSHVSAIRIWYFTAEICLRTNLMKGMKCDGGERMVFRTHIPFTALQPASFFFFFFFQPITFRWACGKKCIIITLHLKKKRHWWLATCYGLVPGAHFLNQIRKRSERRDEITAAEEVERMPLQSARRCIFFFFCTRRCPLFYQRFFLFYVNYWLANLVGGPLWDSAASEPDSFICSPEPGDSRVPAVRACASLCVSVRTCRVCVCVCVSCVCVSAVAAGVGGVGGWGGGGGGVLILGCISTGAGLGHINILINMRESITGEARA